MLTFSFIFLHSSITVYSPNAILHISHNTLHNNSNVLLNWSTLDNTMRKSCCSLSREVEANFTKQIRTLSIRKSQTSQNFTEQSMQDRFLCFSQTKNTVMKTNLDSHLDINRLNCISCKQLFNEDIVLQTINHWSKVWHTKWVKVPFICVKNPCQQGNDLIRFQIFKGKLFDTRGHSIVVETEKSAIHRHICTLNCKVSDGRITMKTSASLFAGSH